MFFVAWGTAPAAAAETTQHSCTFSVPKPTVVSGKASFTIKMTCGRLNSLSVNRQMVVDLVGDDPWPLPDKVMKWSVKNTYSAKYYQWTFTGWPCNEDNGDDELYLRVHSEVYTLGGWQKKGWVNGPRLTGAKCS